MKAFYTRGLTHARTCATDTKTSAERTPPHSRRPGSPARVPVAAARALASGEHRSLPISRPVCLLQGSLHPASRSRPAHVRRLPHPGGVATSVPRSGGLAVQLGPPGSARPRPTCESRPALLQPQPRGSESSSADAPRFSRGDAAAGARGVCPRAGHGAQEAVGESSREWAPPGLPLTPAHHTWL